MNDISNLMHNIGANVHYRQFHDGTIEGHTQVPRRASPLRSTEPKEDFEKALYDPEGAQYESHPVAQTAIPHIDETRTMSAEEDRSWDPDRRRRLDAEIWGDGSATGFSRYAPQAEPVREAQPPQSRLLKDIFARLERVGRQNAGRVQ
jgi:hypothetical protein